MKLWKQFQELARSQNRSAAKQLDWLMQQAIEEEGKGQDSSNSTPHVLPATHLKSATKKKNGTDGLPG